MTATASRNDQLRRLGVLIAIAFVDMVGFMLVLPLLPFYALDLHATPFQIGLIYSAFSIAHATASSEISTPHTVRAPAARASPIVPVPQ